MLYTMGTCRAHSFKLKAVLFKSAILIEDLGNIAINLQIHNSHDQHKTRPDEANTYA